MRPVRFALRRRRRVDRGELRRAWRALRPALAGQRLPIALAVALTTAVTALEVLRPWPIKWVIDRLTATSATPGVRTGSYVGTVALAAIAFAIPAAIGQLNVWLALQVARISRKATVRIRLRVYEQLHRLDLDQHQTHYSGDLLVRLMGDVNMVRDLLFNSWLNILSRTGLVVATAAMFAVLDWRLFCVVLVPVPLLLVGVDTASRRVREASTKQRRKEGAIASIAAESMRQVRVVKAFTAERRAVAGFAESARSAERAQMVSTREAAKMERLTEALGGLSTALVLAIGAARVQSGLMTTGELLVAVTYARTLYKPLRKMSGEGARLGKATACANRVVDLLELPAESPTAGRPAPRLAGHLTFLDVSHRYPDGRESLRELRLHVPAGSLLAICGENGAGKSTLLNLVLRMYKPSAGRVYADGIDISELQLESYREQISYVPQELALFGATIRENIAYSRPGATEAEIARAAELALLTPVIESLPAGFDTVLGENGASLSGGQARRLMLARAALRDGAILLLDEPLAGLDPQARETVASAIRRVADGRTTLVVHHGPLAELKPDYAIELIAGRRVDNKVRPLAVAK